MTWWHGRLAAFDLETTSPDPEEARIVTASVAMCGGGLATETRSWIVNPGIEIPEEAVGIHGITTEQAIAVGREPADAIEEIIAALAARPEGSPVVAFNMRFDLTVLDREARRYGIVPLQDRGELLGVDPSVLDRKLDRYRPSYLGKPRNMTNEEAKEKGYISSRTLIGMCQHYGVTLEAAHDADEDAIAAARLAFWMAKTGRCVRRHHDAEYHAVASAWEAARGDVRALHALQVEWARELALDLANYFRDQELYDKAAEVRTDWPIHALVPTA